MALWAHVTTGIVDTLSVNATAPDSTWIAAPSSAHVGYSYDGSTFAPTIAQQGVAAMSAGIAITSTGTPALNGTYACDDAAQSHIAFEMLAIINSGGNVFADGTTSVSWPDMAGVNHTFTLLEFKPFAAAFGAYVAALFKCIYGTLGTLPAASVTIP